MISSYYRRFEEVTGGNDDDDKKQKEAPSKGKKRPAEGMDIDEEIAGTEAKLTKAQKKALKKQKGENGQAVTLTSPESKGEKKKDKKENKEKAKEGAPTSTGELQELPGGLQYRDVKIGEGANAKKGSSVKMRYIGKLTDGTIFDQNTKGKPFSFRIGEGEVIKGWDTGIPGMKVGGERELIIPPALAYGKRKQSGIPPNSTLRFEVKLVAVN